MHPQRMEDRDGAEDLKKWKLFPLTDSFAASGPPVGHVETL